MTQILINDISAPVLGYLVEKKYKAKSIFLVTGKSSYRQSGAFNFIQEVRSFLDVPIYHFNDFEINPKIEDAIKGASLFHENNCDLIIAIGGGSVIDMAKAVNIFQSHPGTDYYDLVRKNQIEYRGSPLIAIPTTAGSGSEATAFSVIYIGKKKYSLSHEFILPDVAGLNWRFIQSQPKYVAACCGLDALAQAVESSWSVQSTEESLAYVTKALELLLPNLEKSIHAPDRINLEAVLKGAHYAGQAINITRTTAPHAISYAFTTFFSIPHGHAVFLTLPGFIVFNYLVEDRNSNDKRGPAHIRKSILLLCELMGARGPQEMAEYLRSYAASLGVELSLTKLGITGYQSIIAGNVNIERLNNNPRKVSAREIMEILEE